MGTIREYKKEDGSITYHAEVRLKGYPKQRASFQTKTLPKKQEVAKVSSGTKNGLKQAIPKFKTISSTTMKATYAQPSTSTFGCVIIPK